MAARKPRKYTLVQQRRDPNKRRKLPMSSLTPTQQAARRQNQRIARDNANPLYNPGQQLAGHTLARVAKQLTDASYKPKEAALGREMTSATTQGNALVGRGQSYYEDLARRAAADVAHQQALGEMLKTSTAKVGTDSRAALETERAAEASARQAAGGMSSQNRAAEELAAAQGRSSTLQQAAEERAGSQAASANTMMAGLKGATAMRGQEIVGQLLNRLANKQEDVRGRQTDLSSAKGDDLVKQLLGLRQSSFENAATMAGLDLKQSDLALDAKKAAAANTTANRRITETAKSNKASRAQQKALAGERLTQSERNSLRSSGINPDTGKPIPGGKLDPKKKPGASKRPRAGLGSLTQAQENTLHGDIRKARTVIKQYYGKLQPDQLRQGLNQGYLQDKSGKKLTLPKLDPLYIEAALELEHGGLKASTAKKLQQSGVHLGGRYRVRPRSRKRSTGLTGGLIDALPTSS